MVAISTFDEQVMTLVEAAGWLERRFGRRPNAASVWRWATKGIKGVRLATISLGRFRYTTESALERFIAETSRLDAGKDRAAGFSESTAVASAKPGFTKAEVTAAFRRREREKTKALEYLRSRLGSAGPRQQAAPRANKAQEDPRT
jgi:hypothetical protein